jgi:hypothetical protein
MVGAKEAKQSTKQQEHHLYQHRHSGLTTLWASKATVQVCKGQAIHVMVQLLVSDWAQ